MRLLLTIWLALSSVAAPPLFPAQKLIDLGLKVKTSNMV